MSNPFLNWTPEMAAAHNARVAGQKPPGTISQIAALEAVGPAVAQGMRESTTREKLNQTERAYLAVLESENHLWFGVQCITLHLGFDCRLTMDFVIIDAPGMRMVDTKAMRKGKVHYEDDAIVKMRVAARLYPFIRFQIAWKDGVQWLYKDIKP